MITGLVRLGILKGEIDELIANNAHRPYFMHGLSHWLGLDVHDVGNYDTDRSRVLEPGMVLTVEPGLYIATDADVPAQYRGIGIRIEDDIVITEDGNENLTASVVKPMMAFIGVRMSCDIFARKSDLTLLAVSACRVAMRAC